MSAWRHQAEGVADCCAEHLPGLVAVYVHGSAALGGFGAASDLDMLVVSRGTADWPALGHALLMLPGVPLELSVVGAEAAAHPAPPWPYRLHVNSAQRRWTLGETGDPDLIAHYLVTRTAGVAIRGPAPGKVLGIVPRAAVLGYLRDELAWGLTHADQRYVVLNACRATAYAADGLVLAKVDGAAWWETCRGPSPVVAEALAAQRAGEDLGPCQGAARRFVARVAASL